MDRDKSEGGTREGEDRKGERKEKGKRGRGRDREGKETEFRVSQEGDGKERRRLGIERKEEIKGRKLLFLNLAGVYNKDREFWEFIREHDYISLNETWLEEKGWEMIKNKLPKSYEWECSFATKEKRKGRAKGGIIVGKRKKWGVTSKMTVEEDLVLTEIEERKEIFVIISVYNRKEWKETEERINRMVEEKVLNYMIIGEDLKQES